MFKSFPCVLSWLRNNLLNEFRLCYHSEPWFSPMFLKLHQQIVASDVWNKPLKKKKCSKSGNTECSNISLMYCQDFKIIFKWVHSGLLSLRALELRFCRCFSNCAERSLIQSAVSRTTMETMCKCSTDDFETSTKLSSCDVISLNWI